MPERFIVSIVLGGHAKEFLTGQGVVTKATQHTASNQVGAGLMDATSRHAVMLRLDDYPHALRPEDIVDGIGDLRRHLFLDLQALGIDVNHARQLGDAHHAAVWNVGHPGPALRQAHREARARGHP
jgi:hypothetical protein